jgi:hypothetical protein
MDAILRSKRVASLAEELVADERGAPVSDIKEACYRVRKSRRDAESSDSSESSQN